jgi:hypothetical protein
MGIGAEAMRALSGSISISTPLPNSAKRTLPPTAGTRLRQIRPVGMSHSTGNLFADAEDFSDVGLFILGGWRSSEAPYSSLVIACLSEFIVYSPFIL